MIERLDWRAEYQASAERRQAEREALKQLAKVWHSAGIITRGDGSRRGDFAECQANYPESPQRSEASPEGASGAEPSTTAEP